MKNLKILTGLSLIIFTGFFIFKAVEQGEYYASGFLLLLFMFLNSRFDFFKLGSGDKSIEIKDDKS